MNQQIRAKCIATKLVDVKDFEIEATYYKLLRPDGELYLNINQEYFVLGFLTSSGTPWLYVFSPSTPFEIEFHPAVLFDLEWTQIPDDWYIRIHENHEVEIVPFELAKVDAWFEKYIDQDEKIVELVKRKVSKMLSSDESPAYELPKRDNLPEAEFINEIQKLMSYIKDKGASLEEFLELLSNLISKCEESSSIRKAMLDKWSALYNFLLDNPKTLVSEAQLEDIKNLLDENI